MILPDAVLEWYTGDVRGLKAACFHEFLREANLAGEYDRPWMALSPEKRKELTRHYRNIQLRKKNFEFTPQSNPFAKEAKKPRAFAVRDPDAVRICWTYTDKELLKAFAKWLKENRPKESNSSKQGQKHNSDLVNLERIAVFRLLKTKSRDELLSQTSLQGRYFKSKGKYIETNRSRLRTAFFKLFPKFEELNIGPRCLPPIKKKAQRSSPSAFVTTSNS